MSGAERIARRVAEPNLAGWHSRDLVFGVAAFVTDAAVVVGLSVATSYLYHLIFYDQRIALSGYAGVGVIAALVYTLPFISRGDYSVQGILSKRHGAYQVALNWLLTYYCLAVIGYYSKTTAQFSRGWLLVFFLAGLVALVVAKRVILALLSQTIAAKKVPPRRVVVVGV